MKKIFPINENKLKKLISSKQTNEKQSLKISKSMIFLGKRHKNSDQLKLQDVQLSKNDLRIPIYTDKDGFIVQYSILHYGLKCDCRIHQDIGKKSPKSGANNNIILKQNSFKKSIKLQITLSKSYINITKQGVQHIFPLPQQKKHTHLKILLLENWILEQFSIPNKKIKIYEAQILSAVQKKYDQIYPLKNIAESEYIRKNRLAKANMKLSFAWGNPIKQVQNQDACEQNNKQFLSIQPQRKKKEIFRSMIVQQTCQIPKTAFLRKSYNENDHTRDSQSQQTQDDKIFFEKKDETVKNQKRNDRISININFSDWKHHQDKERKNKNILKSQTQINFFQKNQLFTAKMIRTQKFFH